MMDKIRHEGVTYGVEIKKPCGHHEDHDDNHDEMVNTNTPSKEDDRKRDLDYKENYREDKLNHKQGIS